MRRSCIALFVLIVVTCVAAVHDGSRVPYSELSMLTFHATRYTVNRAATPRPQLQCTGGTAACAGHLLPQTVTCDQAHDGTFVCAASSLSDAVDLGATHVACEGWSHANDAFVVAGSCALTYELHLATPHHHTATSDEEPVTAPDAVRLDAVPELEFHAGRFSAYRRTSAEYQMTCLPSGAAGCEEPLPQYVYCRNLGYEGKDLQWQCSIESDVYDLGAIAVVCEGYRWPGDNWVLRDSCFIEYDLNPKPQPSRMHRLQQEIDRDMESQGTPAGQEAYPHNPTHDAGNVYPKMEEHVAAGNSYRYETAEGGGSPDGEDGGGIGFLVFIIALVSLVYCCCGKKRNRRQRGEEPAGDAVPPQPPASRAPAFSSASSTTTQHRPASHTPQDARRRPGAPSSSVGGTYSR